MVVQVLHAGVVVLQVQVVPPQVQHVHPTIMVELLGHNNVDAKIQVVVGTNGEAKQPHDNIDSFQAWCQKNIVLDSMSINDTTPT